MRRRLAAVLFALAALAGAWPAAAVAADAAPPADAPAPPVVLQAEGPPAAPASASATAPADEGERVQITDPYIELHTGPGRGYPVAQVVERHQWITLVLRFTDWYKVRTAQGREGWVQRTQLESTLTDSGEHKTFRDVLLDDYLHRKLEMGAAWGRFKSEPMLKLWLNYKPFELFDVEATVGEVQGTYSGTNFWHLSLIADPFADRRLAPFFGLGLGTFKNIPNASLVDAVTANAKLANAMVGLRYHLSERFVLRLDGSVNTAYISNSRTDEYRALTIGVGFFF